MKLSSTSSLLAIACSALVSANADAAPPASPGRVNFGSFPPSDSGAEYVEINISSTLIGMAAQLIEKHEPEVAKLINGLRSIQVNVVGINDQNRAELEQRAQKVRDQLNENGWEQVVAVKQRKQDVGIYLKTQDQQVVQGLTVVVFEGNKQAVFINVDGNIRPEQLALVGERFHLEELEKAGRHSGEQHAEAKQEK